MSADDDFLQELRRDFLEEVSFLLEQCEESYLKLEVPEARPEELTKIFRAAHSIKGTGTAVGFTELAGFAHIVEDCLTILRAKPELVSSAIISLLLRAGDALKGRIQALKNGDTQPWTPDELKKEILSVIEGLGGQVANEQHAEPAAPAAEGTHAEAAPEAPKETSQDPAARGEERKDRALVKVDPARIDAVLDLVGELVVIKGQLLQENMGSATQRGREILALLDKTARDLQDKTLFMRLTQLRPLFLRAQRIVRDLSLQLHKPVDFEIQGEDIEIDRSMIELLSDPLVHIVRNAMDHGLEAPEARAAAGKPEKGSLRMSARHSGGRIVLELTDDGGGIKRAPVLRKAKERGLVDAAAPDSSFSDEDVYNMLFLPGFSTAEKITDVSGRGVGLDVVKSNVEKLKGTITIESQPGKGTTFRISLPLTTAITDGIIVVISKQRFVVPMNNILEIVQLGHGDIHPIVDGQAAALVRGHALPLLPMGEALAMAECLQYKGFDSRHEDGKKGARPIILVIEVGRRPVALQVDGVIGQSQVVVKSLGDYLKGSSGLAGASILGDGKIALVLDVDGLAARVRPRKPSITAPLAQAV